MNSETVATETPKRPLYKRTRFWILVIILSPIFVFSIWRTLLAIEVSRKLDKIINAGYPIKGAQINAFYKAVPESNNAAILMEEAFRLYRPLTGKKSNELGTIVLRRDEALSEKHRALLVEYVTQNSNTLEKVTQALTRSESHYTSDMTQGWAALMPYLAHLRTISDLLRYKACLECGDQLTTNAMDTLAAIPGVAQTLDSDPNLVSQLVRIRIISIGVSGLEFCLPRLSLNDADLVKLQRAYTLRETNRIAFGLIGDRATGIPSFRPTLIELRCVLLSFEDPAYFPMTAITASPFTLVGATGFFERDLNFYLDATETIIATSKLPPPLCLNATNLSENQRRQAIKSHFYISAMMLPSLSKPVVKEVQCTAQLRLALSAIAVERYRLALGKLPDALGDLVPKYLPSVPEDPFDGQPIRFKHVEEGYVIYSIGPDGIDDGGRERLSLGSAKAKNIKVIPDETYDITFTVER